MLRSFIKMHGLGNDFAVFDRRGQDWLPDAARITALADRHTGIGFDQFILLDKPSAADADVYMHIYNGDGTIVGACGNATRCVAHLLMQELKKDLVAIETKAGKLIAVRSGSQITIDMGEPRLNWEEIPVRHAVDTLAVEVLPDLPPASLVNMGNPHAVFFPTEEVDVAGLGAQIEMHHLFPEKTNVEFVKVIDHQTLRMKVWERGAGITKACGTGACASLVAGVRRGLVDRQAKVILDGGTLDIDWRESDNHVLMTGPAVEVFRGEAEI